MEEAEMEDKMAEEDGSGPTTAPLGKGASALKSFHINVSDRKPEIRGFKMSC